jgi:nitroreductase
MSGHAHSAAQAALGIAARRSMRAPSVFNTQPWRWEITGATVTLHVDEQRRLDVTDPDGRLLMLSCGAALHHATVTIAAEGWTPVVERFADDKDPGLVARVRLGAYAPTDDEARRLAAAIEHRHSDRRSFGERPVPEELLTRLRRAVEAQGAYLHVVRGEQVPKLAAAMAKAAAVERDDPAYAAELDRWTHRPAEAGDGVPAETAVRAAPRRVPVREFAPDDAAGLTAGGHDSGAVYTLLFGASEERDGLLRGGEALSALLLTATAEGLSTSLFSEALETEWPRRLLTELLGEVGVPYLVVRLGYVDADAPPPAAPRRAATEVVDFRES